MPYCQAGWYYRAATAYLLDKKKIQWEDIKYIFNSTAHLKSDAFAEAITKVQETWKSLPGCCRRNQPDLQKHAINAAIGSMRAKDAAENWICVSSRNEEDVSKIIHTGMPFDNGVCVDWYESTPILSNEAYHAIREQILQEEHLRMSIACDVLASAGIHYRQLHSFRTDAVIVHSTKKQAKEAKDLLVQVRREALHRPRSVFSNRLLKESPGQGQIFRVFNCEVPPEHKDGIILELQRRSPHVLPDITVFREGECDIEEVVLDLARKQRSFLLFGPPGTGKSYLLQRVLELVNNAVVCARTHVATAQFDHGETLSRFKHRIQNGFFKGTLVLDELFMVENSLLDVVSRIALNNHFMIFAGDDCQLPPINDLYHGQSVPSLMTSDLLKTIAPIRIELNVCKRSDLALHNFGLLCRWESLAHCMDEARRV